MRLGTVCGVTTKAGARYQRRVLVTMLSYAVVLGVSVRVVRHSAPHGWLLYFWALLPAIPVIVLLVAMGRYLHEETDEYQRTLLVRSLLVATAALLGTVVVSDFLRSFAKGGDLAPFVLYLIFFVTFAITQGVQQLRDRGASDE